MKKQKMSEDRRKTQSSNSVREYSDTIPIDLLIDIFSRVPAKSIARFRCLSKFWASILIRSDFTELFFTNSWIRPRILFIIRVNEEFFVFSSPQPQNPQDKNCSLVATRYKNFPERVPIDMCQHLYGLIFLQTWKNNERVIYNPITRKFMILPNVKEDNGRCYLCYDPTNKQFKVLRINWSRDDDEGLNTHSVLTLETTKRCWKTIECKRYFHSNDDGICINGMLYYKADDTIVCFDVRYEKFSFISVDMFEDTYSWILTNYKGKLGAHHACRNQFDTELVLWVLEDVVNNKWSKNICVLTPLCNKMMAKSMGYSVRATRVGEIVFSPNYLVKPFYIIYYNFERNTFTRVEIQGFKEFVHNRLINVTTFLDYVENMKLGSQDDDGCRRSKRPKKPILKYTYV